MQRLSMDAQQIITRLRQLSQQLSMVKNINIACEKTEQKIDTDAKDG